MPEEPTLKNHSFEVFTLSTVLFSNEYHYQKEIIRMMGRYSLKAIKHLSRVGEEWGVGVLGKGSERENGVTKKRGPHCSSQGVWEIALIWYLFHDLCWVFLHLSANF